MLAFYVNKAARLVVDHCLANDIGVVVLGWNTGQKDSINLGAKKSEGGRLLASL